MWACQQYGVGPPTRHCPALLALTSELRALASPHESHLQLPPKIELLIVASALVAAATMSRQKTRLMDTG